MRSTLFLALLGLAVSGCGAFDCPSAGEYRTVENRQRLQSRPEASDTLTVVFQAEPRRVYAYLENVWIGLGADVPRASESGEVEIGLEVEYSTYDAVQPPPLRASARRDTVVVGLEDVLAALPRPACAQSGGLFQPACSYAEPTYTLFVGYVEAPESVQHVRFRIWDGSGIYPLTPSASPSPPVSFRRV